MTKRRRIVIFFLVLLLSGLSLAGGTWLELNIFRFVDVNSLSPSLTHVGVFFGVLNLNLLLLAVFVFLVLKNAVRLAVDRKKGVFGSSLRTKLVTAFLFFALLPTVILLYMTSKFVNANFDKWLPASLVEVSSKSAQSERIYQSKLLEMLDELPERSSSDFGYYEGDNTLALSTEVQTRLGDPKDLDQKTELIRRTVLSSVERLKGNKARWFSAGEDLLIALRRTSNGRYIGIVAPPTIHTHWQLLAREFSEAGPGVELLRFSYYLMLAVLTLLILFSATWLGFTIAREYTDPILVLAQATDKVAQGDYTVEIDEIISDDEMGRLAQSFRSMVDDLRKGHEAASTASAALAQKASELKQNSEYNAFLIEHVHSGVVVVSATGIITTWNDKAAKIFGKDSFETIGKSAQQIFEREFFELVLMDLLALDAAGNYFETHHNGNKSETNQIHSDQSLGVLQNSKDGLQYRGVFEGRERQLQVTVSQLGISSQSLGPKEKPDRIILFEDLTELARAQRVAAWRDVARRVAHEIKNPLTPITLGMQRLQRRFQSRFEGSDLEVFQDSTRTVLDSTESIRRLVEEFIRFARMPQALLTSGNIVEATQLAVSGFSLDDGETIALEVSVQTSKEKSPTVLPPEAFGAIGKSMQAIFDKDQIVRMLTNLIANAKDACRDSGSKVSLILFLDGSQGECVFRVIDEGPGIPMQLRAKIFEPYFSTRRRGSGLGLPIVRQIVSEHRGEITVLDNLPKGTEFRIALPILVSRSTEL